MLYPLSSILNPYDVTGILVAYVVTRFLIQRGEGNGNVSGPDLGFSTTIRSCLSHHTQLQETSLA